MNPVNFEHLFSQLETQVREGHGSAVAHKLLAIKINEIPRKQLSRFANLARRTGLSKLCLRALYPILNSEKSVVPASSGEIIEYAAALIVVGATKEANKLLSNPDIQKQEPRALFFLAMTHFRNWQYEESIPYLKTYVDSMVDSYSKLVGSVNLCAAYCSTGQLDIAATLVSSLLKESKKINSILLHGNLLEIAGQIEFYNQRFVKALEYFCESEKILKNTAAHSSLYPRKWQYLLKAKQESSIHSAFMVMAPIMEEARKQRDWETLRDIDKQLGIFFQDMFVAAKLYFGTPFANYRNGLSKFFKGFSPLNDFFLCDRWQNAIRGPTLELHTAKLNNKDIGIKVGSLPHQLFGTLLKDFYRPFSAGTLFGELFPDEFYNPFTSYDRVYQSVKRLRIVFNERRLPIRINQWRYEYSVKLVGPVNIHLRSQDLSLKSEHLKNTHLHEVFKTLSTHNVFSVKDLMGEMNVSLRSANRVLSDQVEKGNLVRLGKGKNTRYKLVG